MTEEVVTENVEQPQEPQAITRADLATMTPGDIVDAYERGDLNHLHALSTPLVGLTAKQAETIVNKFENK